MSSPEDDEDEPPSRAPQLPADLPPAEAARRHRHGPGGTVRMMAPPRVAPPTTQGSTVPPGRPSLLDRPSLVALRQRASIMRQTLLSALPPIPKSLAALGGPAAALGVVVVLAISSVVWLAATGRLPEGMRRPFAKTEEPEAMAPPPLPPNAELADDLVGPSAEPGRGRIGRGVLSVPKTFRAGSNGEFDLVVHFHGNTELALESYEVALLDAVVLVVNLGNGSGVYEDTYRNPASLQRILDTVPSLVEKRGLQNAHVRRVALVGWSAGYGAIMRALEHPAHADRVDAVVLLDGLHASYRPGTRDVETASLASIERFAERAVRAEKLLVITHSNIDPVDYLGVRETVDVLLGKLKVERREVRLETQIPALRSAKGVLPKADLRPLQLRDEARTGGLVVRGFGGNEAAHHIGHLMQMSELALPEVAKRWGY